MIIQAFTKHGALIEEIVVENDDDIYFEFEDIYGRRWKLIPVENPTIIMPLVIKPIQQEIENENNI